MSYQVDSADGRCLYRGNDLELACEIHDQLPDAHLVVMPSQTDPRREVTSFSLRRIRPCTTLAVLNRSAPGTTTRRHAAAMIVSAMPIPDSLPSKKYIRARTTSLVAAAAARDRPKIESRRCETPAGTSAHQI